MSRHTGIQLLNKATFFNDMTINLDGHKGYGADINVEVEFTASRPVAATWTQPAEGEEIEIVAVRPILVTRTPRALKQTTRTYLDCPAWLAADLQACIDAAELTANWRDYDAREYEKE
jgi:hypothetical protein